MSELTGQVSIGGGRLMSPEPGLRAGIYARVSTADQHTDAQLHIKISMDVSTHSDKSQAKSR